MMIRNFMEFYGYLNIYKNSINYAIECLKEIKD